MKIISYELFNSLSHENQIGFLKYEIFALEKQLSIMEKQYGIYHEMYRDEATKNDPWITKRRIKK